MYGPSDMYGDMTIEDVDDFEGLESDDRFREVNPLGRFERNEFRKLDEDFEVERDEDEESPLDRFVGYDDNVLYDSEAPLQEMDEDDEQ